MTVSSTISRVTYMGNGSTTGFAVPFMFIRDEDVTVVLSRENGIEQVLDAGSDYELEGQGEQTGGVCFLGTAPLAGETLVLKRDPCMVQETDYLENDSFPAQSHERALDLLTMICQSLSEKLDRTISLSISSAVTGVQVPDPEPGRVLVWNEAGSSLENREVALETSLLLPLPVAKGGTGAENSMDALAALGAEPADSAILKADKAGQELLVAVSEPHLVIEDGESPDIDLDSRNRFVWTLGADRTFPTLAPAQQGQWDFIIHTQGHVLTLDSAWDGLCLGTPAENADMVMLTLISDGQGLSLACLNRAEEAEVETVTGADVGDFKLWSTETPPEGWLECDGSELSRSAYAALFAVIGTMYGAGDGAETFILPDMRGRFLRGWDHGKGLDPDAIGRTDRGDGTGGDAIGTLQADQFRSHVHQYYASNVDGGNAPFACKSTGSTQNTLTTGGSETRPCNMNVMVCIKY